MSETEPPPRPPDDDEIEDPFDTETINYFQTDRDRLAVALAGRPAANGELEIGTAAHFLHRLNELLHALGAHVQSRAVGVRGKLPQLTGAGGLAFAAITDGSAILHFRAVDQPEQLIITQSGRVASAMEEAAELLLQIVESSASDEALLQQLRRLPERIGTNYAELLDVIITANVGTAWQSVDRRAGLPLSGARRARSALDREIIVDVSEDERIGLLYEANAKERHFRLDTEGRGTIVGEYHEDLTDVIRAAWNRRVRLRLQLTVRRLERSHANRPADVELIEILEVFPDELA